MNLGSIRLGFSFLHRHNFDGLEIDWEYPGLRGGQADDKHYLTLLLQVRDLFLTRRKRRRSILTRSLNRPRRHRPSSPVNLDYWLQQQSPLILISPVMLMKSKRSQSNDLLSDTSFVTLYFSSLSFDQSFGLHQHHDLVSAISHRWRRRSRTFLVIFTEHGRIPRA